MITIEQIDEFRKRTHSSYEDAKYFLEKNNGDVLEAIIDFERTKTGRSHYNRHNYHRNEDYGKKFADILQKGFDTRIFVEDKNTSLFNIPVILLVLLIPLWIIILLIFIFFIMLGYKVSIKDVKSENININNLFNNISDKMKDSGSGTKPANNQNKADRCPVPSNINVPAADKNGRPEAQNSEKSKEDDYKEYTIE